MLLLIVFLSAFGAATILPIASEITVVAAFKQGENAFLIWLFASIGNVLGAVVNYVIGKYLVHFKDRKWFPFSASRLDKGSKWFQRYGMWSLLLSWMPVFGDAVTLVAGVMNVRFSLFLVLVAIGKSARYAIMIFALIQL